MGYDRDRHVVLTAAKAKLGSQGAVGRFLGMKKQQISRLYLGRGDLTGEQLAALLKLLGKPLACVLIAVGLAGHPTDSGATGTRSEHGRSAESATRLYNLHIVQLWKSILRWLSLPLIGPGY